MKFTIPTRIILGKKKKRSFPLNANTFANQHHRLKHNAKMQFYDYINSLDLRGSMCLTYTTPIKLSLEYYTERKPNFDEDNIYFGLHKFTADALVNIGLIQDDTFRYVKHGDFKYMGVDKRHHFGDKHHLKGRCDVEVIVL